MEVLRKYFAGGVLKGLELCIAFLLTILLHLSLVTLSDQTVTPLTPLMRTGMREFSIAT